MNFNTLKNVPNAIYLQSAPARARNSAIVTVILLFLVFAGFVQAVEVDWDGRTGKQGKLPSSQKINNLPTNNLAVQRQNADNALQQLLQSCKGVQDRGLQGQCNRINDLYNTYNQQMNQWSKQQQNLQQQNWQQQNKQREKYMQDTLKQINDFYQSNKKLNSSASKSSSNENSYWNDPNVVKLPANGGIINPYDLKKYDPKSPKLQKTIPPKPTTTEETLEQKKLSKQNVKTLGKYDMPYDIEVSKNTINSNDLKKFDPKLPKLQNMSSQAPNKKGPSDNPSTDNASSVGTASVFGEEGMVRLLREHKKTISGKEFAELRHDLPRIDELNNKTALSSEESKELRELTTKRNTAWGKVVSNTDLTQEERERLQLKMQVAPAVLDGYAMVDPRALAERERKSDPVLDVAFAAASAGATKAAVSMIGKGGKEFLKADQGTADGFDTVKHLGEAEFVKRPKNDADKFVAVGDYALTYLPNQFSTTKMVVDVTANALGAAARETTVLYWASKDNYSYTPKKDAKDKWDSLYMDQNQWTRAAMDRVSMGEYK